MRKAVVHIPGRKLNPAIVIAGLAYLLLALSGISGSFSNSGLAHGAIEFVHVKNVDDAASAAVPHLSSQDQATNGDEVRRATPGGASVQPNTDQPHKAFVFLPASGADAPVAVGLKVAETTFREQLGTSSPGRWFRTVVLHI